MKVAIFIRSLSAHGIGGMEFHTHLLSEALVEKGVEVSIITTAHPEGKTHENRSGVDIYYLQGTLPRSYSPEWWMRSYKQFMTLNNKSRFDIIHSQSIGAYGILKHIKNNKIPLVTTSHGTPVSDSISYVGSNKFAIKLFTFLDIVKYLPKHYKMYHASNKVIAVSNELNKHISGFFFKRSNNIVTVLNGVDTTRFNPEIESDEVRNEYGIATGENVVLFVGRIIQEKGVQNIIAALPQIRNELDNVKLVIVGDGAYLPEVKSLVKSKSLSSSVIITGKVPDEQIPKLYALADVFVSPTLRIEGLPYNVLEAMAAGRAVVASDIGGISNLIEHNTDGVLLPAGDIKSLAQDVVDLLNDRPKISKLGRKAREKILNQFSVQKMTEETIAIYEEI